MSKKIFFFKKIRSTNTKAKDFSKKGINDVVIVSEEQSEARGRFGRKWISGKGGLWLSILFRENNVEKSQYLTFIGAICVVKAIKKITNLETKIKWPNDVHFESRKLCGILTEAILGKGNYIIVGIGLNVNQLKFPKEIKNIATSLRIILKKEFNKEKILKKILKEFELLYHIFKKKKFEKILSEWKELSDTIGKNVKVVSMNKTYYGEVIDVDENCNLVLKLKNKIKKIREGDVFYL
jgi:BirA family biotin operon repressor/biotin-[acetyl-CoA-carboxylase] ligase